MFSSIKPQIKLYDLLNRIVLKRQVYYTLLFVMILLVSAYFVGSDFTGHYRSATHLLSQQAGRYVLVASQVLGLLSAESQNECESGSELDAAIENYPYFDVLYLVDTDGRLLDYSPKSLNLLEGMDFSEQPFFKHEMSTDFISEPFLSNRTGNPTIYLSTISPQGKIVAGELSLAALQESVAETELYEKYSFFISDQAGNLIAHPNFDLVRQRVNMRSTGILENLESVGKLQIFRQEQSWMVGVIDVVDQTGWLVVTEAPLWSVIDVLVIPIAIGLLMTAIVFFFVMFSDRAVINHWVITPLTTLGMHTRRLAEGNYEEAPSFQQMPVYAEILSLSEDFEEMKQAVITREKALRESEERNRLALEATNDGLWDWDLSTGHIRTNAAFQHMLGSNHQSYIMENNQFASLLHPDDRKKVLKTIESCLDNGTGHFEMEYRLRRSDQTWVWVLGRGKVVSRNAQGKASRLMGTHVNISERKNLEAQMIAAEKLSGIGTLTAGIAHELNTPLQLITGQSESLLRDVKNDRIQTERLQEKLESINNSAWHSARVIRSLLTYAHPESGQLEYQDLNALVQNTLVLLEHQLKSWSGISVDTDLAADLPPLYCDHSRIVQLLINLINNARDAMPHGGVIHIRTACRPEDHKILLEISDTGRGIPVELRDKIFDPFFTTKPVGEGTGLGLSIVAAIVRVLRGSITVEDAPGMGTLFRIAFPRNYLQEDGTPASQDALGRYS